MKSLLETLSELPMFAQILLAVLVVFVLMGIIKRIVKPIMKLVFLAIVTLIAVSVFAL